MAGTLPAQILSDVDREVMTRFGHRLQPTVSRRASHFYGESQRVTDGIAAWKKGTIGDLGHLMTQSCKSSIKKYECGIQVIYNLQQIVSTARGVHGSRFMGGCVERYYDYFKLILNRLIWFHTLVREIPKIRAASD